ncbi:MAG: flagellar biosynthesis anti-sigma factor FlgM [Spirochaetaceae bacterium]
MTIEPLGPIDPIHRPNQAGKTERTQQSEGKDSVSFSNEARLKAEVYRLTEEVKAGEDVRADRVAEVKQKLQDPNYIDDKVLDTVAERIMDMLDI